MQDNTSYRSQLYKNLIGSGKVTENELGTEDSFIQNLSSPDAAKKFHSRLSSIFTPDEIGDENQFVSSLIPDFEKQPLTVNPFTYPKKQDEVAPMIDETGVFNRPDASIIDSKLSDIKNNPIVSRYEDLQNKKKEAENVMRYSGADAMISPIEIFRAVKRSNLNKDEQKFLDDNKTQAEKLINDRKALYLQKEFVQLADNLEKYDDSASAVSKFITGLTKTGTLKDFATLGLTAMSRNLNLLETLKKAEKKEALTEEESNLLKTYNSFKELEQNQNPSFAFKAGKTFQDMIPFVANMIGTGGLTGGLRASVGGALKLGTWEAAKQAGVKGISKYGIKKLAEGAVVNAVRSPLTTTAVKSLSENIVNRYNVDNNASVQFDPNAPSDKKLLYDTYVQNYLEYFTEELGGAFSGDVAKSLVAPVLKNSPRIKALFGGTINALNKIGGNKYAQAVKKVTDLAQINGIVGQNMEEVINAGLSTALTGSQDWQQFTDNPSELIGLTSINTLLLGGSFTAARYGIGGPSVLIENHKNKKNLNSALNLFRSEVENSISKLNQLKANTEDTEFSSLVESAIQKANEVAELAKNGEFTGPDNYTESSPVMQKLTEFNALTENINGIESLTNKLSKVISAAAIKQGVYTGLVEMAKREMGEFENKKLKNSVVIANDSDGNSFYILDQLEQDGKEPLLVVKPVDGGDATTVSSGIFSGEKAGMNIFPIEQFIDNYLAQRQGIIAQTEQNISEQIDNTPVDSSVLSQKQPQVNIGESYTLAGNPVKVIDVTEDVVFVQDQDGNIHDVQPSDLMDDLPMPADGITTEVITPIEQEQKQQQKDDIERRRQELESSREIETLYDLRNPIAEDSKEIISKIEEANKLRKDAQEKREQAVKETNEEIRIALNSDVNELNEKAQILDKEVKKSRDIVINNTPIKQAINSTWSIGQKLLNKIKLAAKSNEWVSSMPISKEEFTKLEDAIKRLSVKNMGEAASNSEVIPDILLIEEINAKYNAELANLNNQITPQQKQQAQQQEQIQEQIPLTKDGKPDYDNMPPQMLVEQLRANGFDETEITGLVSNVVTNLEKQRSLIDKKAVKSINEATERKSKLKEIDSKINGLKAIIEPAPQEQANSSSDKTENDVFKQKHNSLITSVRTHNMQTPGKKKNTNIVPLLRKANELGYTIKPDNFNNLSIFDSNGNLVNRIISDRPNVDNIQQHKSLNEYPQEFQDFVNLMFLSPDNLVYILPIDRNKIAQGISNIAENKKTIASNDVLDALEQIFTDRQVTLTDTGGKSVDVSLDEYIQVILDANDLPADIIQDDLPEDIIDDYPEDTIIAPIDVVENDLTLQTNTENEPTKQEASISENADTENDGQGSSSVRSETEQGGDSEVSPIDNAEPTSELEAKQAEIAQQELETATHPENDLPEPTQAQKEAGNYKKGHVNIQGFDVTIENPKGSFRSGVDSDGETWSQEMKNTYGYILGTTGRDSEHIDVFLGENPLSEKIFVIDQINKDKSFDEHKVMLGFDDIEEAKAAYLSNYEIGWQGLGNITETTIDKFNDWAKAEGKRIKPFAEYKQFSDTGITLIHNSDNTEHEDVTYLTIVQILHESGLSDALNLLPTYDDALNMKVQDYVGIIEDDIMGRLQEVIEPLNNEVKRLRESLKNTPKAKIEEVKVKIAAINDMVTAVENHITLKLHENVSKLANYIIAKNRIKFDGDAEKDDFVGDVGSFLERPNRDTYWNSKMGDFFDDVAKGYMDMPGPEETPAPEPKQAENKIFTEAAKNEALAKLKAKLNNVNAGFDPEIAFLSMQVGGYYIEKGIRKFAEYAKTMIEEVGEAIKPYLKTSYNAVRDTEGMEHIAVDMDPYDIVKAVDINKLNELQNDADQSRSYEAIEAEAEALEPLSKSIEDVAKNVGDNKQRAGEAKELISEQIQAVEKLLDEVDKKLADLSLSDNTYSTEGIYADYPINVLAKGPIKKDATKFVMAVAQMTGLDYDTDRKGKTQIVDVNIAPDGGEVTFVLWSKNNPEYGVYVSVTYDLELNSGGWYDNYRVDPSGRRITPAILWRITSKKNKYTGFGNMFLPGDTTASELSNAIVKGLNDHFKEMGINMAEKTDIKTENKDNKANNLLTLFDFQQTENTNNKEYVDDKRRRNETTDNQVGNQEREEARRSDEERVDRGSAGDNGLDGERSRGVSELSVRDEAKDVKNGNNNRNDRGVNYAPASPKARFNANIAAIKLMRKLVSAGTTVPTQEQMSVLKKYSGWGGLGTFFNKSSEENKQLKELLSIDEYESAENNINSAYYTPAEIIDTLWDVVSQLGFKGGNILESSAGIGNILGTIPQNINSSSNIHAVEIDSISGNILKLLYPDAKTDIKGFEDTEVLNGSVDLAITNVPFVTGLSVFDKVDKDLSRKFTNIHDFFIAKNIRKLRDGGIGVFITTSGTLDKSKKLREWIANEVGADVVGAFRLNNDTFEGTNATSDIIIVKKRKGGVVSPQAINILDVIPVRNEAYNTGESNYVRGEGWVDVIEPVTMEYNRYFVDHPENMGGEMKFGFETGDTYRPKSIGLFADKQINQSERLSKWAKNFTAIAEQVKEEQTTKPGETTTAREGSLVATKDGEIRISRRGVAEPIGINKSKVKGYEKRQCLADYNAIKTALDNVLIYQMNNENDASLLPLLKTLNNAYDTFVRKYGYLNRNTTISFLKNDVDFPTISALEKYSEEKSITGSVKVDVSKTKVFHERVINIKSEPAPENVKDAVTTSIYVKGYIDTDYISEKLNRGTDDIISEIVNSRIGFVDPATGKVEVRHEYLSGNVREKLEIAKASNTNGQYSTNIAELEKVIPLDIPMHLIEFNLGTTWLPEEIYELYFDEKLGIRGVKFLNSNGAWIVGNINGRFNDKNRQSGVISEMFNKTIYGDELVIAAMNNKGYVVKQTVKQGGETTTLYDKEATQACANKISELKEDFIEFAKGKFNENDVLSEKAMREYNDKFNALVPKVIDDAFLPDRFGGATNDVDLYVHQKKSVIRGTTQALLLAHEVGTGKTFTLISTAMEMRRLGTAKKPMIVVQNATVGQFVSEAKKLYPSAKILTITERDGTAEGRKEFYAKIKYSDWDMIVVPQSTFEMIPDSPEKQASFIQEKIEDKLHAIEVMNDANIDSREIKRAKREIEDLQFELNSVLNVENDPVDKRKGKKDAKRLAKTASNAAARAKQQLDRRTDDAQYFDDMGIDALLIDEAHMYKRLGFATAMTRGVKGIDPAGSKRAAGVYLKTRSIFEKTGWKNVIFATGTPISNTAAEIWTFMKYLIPKETMESNDIYYFDDFVRNFGKIAQALEFTTSGKFKETQRFSAYINLPELVRLWGTIADTVLTKEVEYVNDKVPTMETGKAQDIFLPQTNSLVDIMRAVRAELERFERMTGKEKKQNSHIPITMFGIAKRAAIDARLVSRTALDEPNSKTNRAVAETLRSLKETADYKGTVAIFCDNNRRWDNGVVGFDLFVDIKEKLIEKGVPAEQIAIIKSGMSIQAKEKIFADINSGNIRVVLGNTQTLGTGVNIQERLHTLIHMDAPDRPMDYTQRNGRILRQGNLHKVWGKEVRVLRFGVEDSLDVTSYQRLKTKSGFIESIMDSKPLLSDTFSNRVLEEDEDGLFDNPVAILSGSEYAQLKNAVERILKKYESKKKQHFADQIYIENALKKNASFIRSDEANLARREERLKEIKKIFPDGKYTSLKIDGKEVKGEDALEQVLSDVVNKKVNDKLEKERQNSYFTQGVISFVATLNDVEFIINVDINRESQYDHERKAYKIIMHKHVNYSSKQLDIIDVPVRGGFVKNAIVDIVDNVITGSDDAERIEAFTNSISRMKAENASMSERRGKPFEYEKELDEAKAKVDEYTELMKKELAAKEEKYRNLGAGNTTLDVTELDDEEEINPAIQIQNELREQGVPYRRNKNIRHDPGQSSLWEKSGYNPSINNRVVFAESHLSEIGQINFLGNINGPAKITGANDIAYLFRNLESASSENVFAVFIDKNKKHTVQYVSTGGPTSSVVDPRVIVSAAQRLNAESVYLVHNHPSGNLNASSADISRTGELKEALGHIGKKLAGSIIINLDSGKYSEIDIQSQQTNVHEKLPISGKIIEPKIFAFDRQVLYIPSSERTQINSPGKAAEFLSKQKRGTVPKIHIIYVNNKIEVTAYEFHDETVETNEIIKKIIGNADGVNTAFFLASNTDIPGKELKRIIDATKSISLKLLDYIEIQQDSDIINNYKSYADNGILSEEKPLYGKSILSEPNNSFPFTSKSLPGKIVIDGIERSTKNNLGDPIAQTEEGVRNFWKWFGESQMVDNNGQPIVFYHGTNKEFNVFDKNKFATSNDAGWLGEGFYFYTEKDQAIQYGNTGEYYLKIKEPYYALPEENKRLSDLNNKKASKEFSENLKNEGYDGVYYNGDLRGETVVFEPNQIKSVTNTGQFNPENNDIRFRASYFYSPTEQALNAIKQDKGTVEQFKAMLLKNGAKQSEMEWMQFDDSFPDAKKTITKADIQDWIDENRIEVREVEKIVFKLNDDQIEHIKDLIRREVALDENIADEWQRYKIDNNIPINYTTDQALNNSGDTTQYSQYKLPGGKNYKELLLTMPNKNKFPKDWTITYSDSKNKWVVYDKEGNYQGESFNKEVAIENALNKIKSNFHSGHFDEPNILAHVRFDERTDSNGRKVLFLEELQSDWAQKGKKDGFKQKYRDDVREDENVWVVYRSDGTFADVSKDKAKTPEEARAIADKYTIHWNKQFIQGVPDMPFKKTDQWVNLALRRMMIYAAENGFDRIAWTTGEQQADRYDLSKQVDKVLVSKYKDGYTLKVLLPDRAFNNDQTLIGENLTEAQLEERIGKDLTQKVISDNLPLGQTNVYEGLDLKVGGEGMKAFYDNIVPNAANKIGKPFGANVEIVKISNMGNQQSIPITEKIREQAEIGMPLYKQSSDIKGITTQKKTFEAKTLAEKLNVPVNIITDISEIPATQSLMRRSKGWYNPKTGEISVVIPNNTSVADIQKTILHEAVAHKGLRGLLGSKFSPTMEKIYNSLPDETKGYLLSKYGSNKTLCAEEYCATIAEKDIEPTLWEKIKGFIWDAFRKLGINLQLNDSDISYMLWRSKNRLQNEKTATLKEQLEDKAKADKTKTNLEQQFDSKLHRDNMPPETNDIQLSWSEKKIERWQDRMVSVKKLIDEVKSRGGKVLVSANPYIQENQSSSKAKAEIDLFKQDIYKPLMEQVTDIEQKYWVTYSQISEYRMAKHAKERNKKICTDEITRSARQKIKSDVFSPILEKYPRIIEDEVSRIYDNIFYDSQLPPKDYSELTDLEIKELARLRKHIVGKATEIAESEQGNNRSGYTDIDSEKIVKEFEADVPRDVTDNLHNLIKKSTDFTLNTWLKYGLISKEHYNAMTGPYSYEYYTPLRGWDEKEDIDYLSIFRQDFMGSSILNLNKSAEGRTSKADDPFANIASMAESAVITGNKNEIRRAAWRMIVSNKDMTDLFMLRTSWFVNSNEVGEEPMWIEVFDKPAQQLFDEGRARLNIDRSYDWHKTSNEIDIHSVPVFIDGQRMVMEFKGVLGAKAATAINKMNTANYAVFNPAAKVNRWIAANLTSKNPDFMLTNFTRDYFFGNISYFVKGGSVKDLNKNILTAFKAIHNDRFGKNRDTELQKMYEDFKLNGGQTGYIHLSGVEQFKKDIERLRLHASGVYTLGDRVLRNKAMTAGANALEYMAIMSENAMRFAVYKTELERMMKADGVTEPTQNMKTLAAQAAKDITVNFNRKGTQDSPLAAFFGSMFAFFNASIQGSATFIKLSKENPVRFTEAITAMIALSFLGSLFSALLSGGDDDDKEYDRVSDYVKFNNIVLLNPLSSKKDEFITIPTPHGFRAFASIGPLVVDIISGKRSETQALEELAKNIAGEISPLSLFGFDLARPNSSAGLLAYITPTPIRPFVEAYATNQDYMGNEIAKKNFISSKDGITPQWQLAPKTTNKILVGTSKMINNLFGGTDNISSAVSREIGRSEKYKYGFFTDFNPAKIEHIFEGYLGGRLRFFNDVYKTANSILDKEVPEKQNIPVFRRLYQGPKQKSGWPVFYETRDYVEQIDARMKDFKDRGDIQGEIALNNYYNNSIVSIFKNYEKQILDLSKMINDVNYKSHKPSLEKSRDELLKDFENRIHELNKTLK